MGRSKSKPNYIRGWTNIEREFCVQYYLHNGGLTATKWAYSEKFRPFNGNNLEKCPTSDHIRAWVQIHEDKKKSVLKKQPEEQQRTETNKLSGTQWGRKTGENRIIRIESVDLGEQQQAIKWRQRDIKWNGPRYEKEEEEVVEPVVIEFPKYYYYQDRLYKHEPVVEEVKPDKKKVLKEKFEGEIKELIEALDAPGHAARTSAFVSLRAALQRRAVDGLLAAHRATLADHVSRALRRGKDEERKAAAAVTPLLAVQFGKEGMEQLTRAVRPALIASATDKLASLDTRTECCSSLAVLCYIVEEDLTVILEAMRMYENIFSGSYFKSNSRVKVSDAAVEEGAWHAAALDGWALLLSLLSPNHALSLLNNQAPSFAGLGELLDAASIEVRMAAGSALAIAYETVSGNGNSNKSLAAHVVALLPRLTELARDAEKFRNKKDLRKQRAAFRDILKYFEEGSAPCGSAHIGTETATWCGWSRGAAYAALAGALGGALPVLAPHCARLRAHLQLPAEPLHEIQTQEKPKKLQYEKPKKLHRHLQNKAVSKARSFTRNQNRDKRSIALAA